MNSLPPQRLALSVPPTRKVKGRDFLLFVKQMEKLGVDPESDVTVEILPNGSLKFHMPVPDLNPPKKTRHRQAVEKQIESRRESIAKGEEVPGYVPPVKPRRVVKVPRQKIRRPVKGRAEGSKRE